MSTPMLLTSGLLACYLSLAQDTAGVPAGAKHWTQPELEQAATEIQAQIEKLRGESFERPVAVKLASAEDLRKYVRERTAKTETPEKIAADEAIARLLGAIPVQLDLLDALSKLIESQVVGFYDPDTESFSLMDTCPTSVARVTMAHELDHALDDQLFAIDSKLAELGNDTDKQLAYWSVVEGSGTAVMTAWTLDHMKELDLTSLASLDELQGRAFEDAPQWLWKPMFATYMQGSAFLQKQDAWVAAQLGRAKSADIRRAFESPPMSTEQVLHPAKYWKEGALDLPQALVHRCVDLPEGWEVLRADTLGELSIAILTTPVLQRKAPDLANPLALMSLKFTNEAAAGWGGDRLVLLGRDDARLLSWNTVWDSPEDAQQFRQALEAQLGDLEHAAKELNGADDRQFGVELQPAASPDSVALVAWFNTRSGEAERVSKAVVWERQQR